MKGWNLHSIKLWTNSIIDSSTKCSYMNLTDIFIDENHFLFLKKKKSWKLYSNGLLFQILMCLGCFGDGDMNTVWQSQNKQ